MVPSFLLALREGLEAALVIGIALGVLAKTQRSDLKPAVWRGTMVAMLVSLLAAMLLNLLGAQFEGRTEQIFEGFAMLAAALLLTWMIFWMQRQGASLQRQLELDVTTAAQRRGRRGLFALAFLAVAREGLELSLFLTASALATDALPTLLGALFGLAAAALLGYLLFATTRRLSLKQFFRITNILLILFAAGLVAHAVHEFNEAALIPPMIEQVWDVNPLLHEDSSPGQVLKALFGYNGNPSLSEVLAYSGYMILIWLLFNKERFARRWLITRAAP
jgi:high-affinity iron transporter